MSTCHAADFTHLMRSNLSVGGGRSGARRPAVPLTAGHGPATERPNRPPPRHRSPCLPQTTPGLPAAAGAAPVPRGAHSPSPTAIMPRRGRGRAGAAGPGSLPQQPPPLQNSSPASRGNSPRYTHTGPAPRLPPPRRARPRPTRDSY